MSAQKPKYAEGWKEFSRRIRFERARGQCECEGECGLHRTNPGPRRCVERNGEPAVWAGGKVMLTVAHLDAVGGPCDCHAREGIKCVIDSHVKAMCNRCHLRMDVDQHKANARRNRANKHGQQWLGDMK
jgi:hypothetical protein